MIEALFSQPNYLGAKKALDAVEMRHQAIASNLANLETPGYKRVDLAPSFDAELSRAFAARDGEQLKALKPQLTVDQTAPVTSPDGNTVNLETELLKMNQNVIAHSVEVQLVSGSLARLKMAINGKSG